VGLQEVALLLREITIARAALKETAKHGIKMPEGDVVRPDPGLFRSIDGLLAKLEADVHRFTAEALEEKAKNWVRGVVPSFSATKLFTVYRDVVKDVSEDPEEMERFLLNMESVRQASVAWAQGMFNIAKNVKYVQGAGMANIALGEVDGVQGAGLGNFSLKKIRGIQASSLANIALEDVKGVQVGLINFCKGDCDFQFGLINYSRNGIFEIGASYTSDEKIRITLNSGNKHLYGIFGILLNPEYFHDRSSERVATALFGLGTRLEAWKFNFDFEVLANEVIFDESGKETKFYPTFRTSAGFTPIKHLNIFAGFGMSIETSGNEEAFIGHKRNLVIDAGSVTLYPEFDLGIKFSLH